ncbi:hypothetical protein BC834DRAFT_1002878 [Gloeopeniophorella convolvens]|nr:hypothetical protein BC834DRAFT_1002878 [Gloeopeniophorella convolvens]
MLPPMHPAKVTFIACVPCLATEMCRRTRSRSLKHTMQLSSRFVSMATAASPRDVERQHEATSRGFDFLIPRMFRTEEDKDKDAGYGDTSAQIWKLYGIESEKYDKALVDSWMGNTDSMLIFTGLFSAIVASFLIETYKTLQPDTGSETVVLLSQLVAQSNASRPAPSSEADPLAFDASNTSVRVNILMFLSLFLSVASALASTLIQQWARDYLQYSQPSAAPHKRGRIRAFMFSGLSQFQMRRLITEFPSSSTSPSFYSFGRSATSSTPFMQLSARWLDTHS